MANTFLQTVSSNFFLCLCCVCQSMQLRQPVLSNSLSISQLLTLKQEIFVPFNYKHIMQTKLHSRVVEQALWKTHGQTIPDHEQPCKSFPQNQTLFVVVDVSYICLGS